MKLDTKTLPSLRETFTQIPKVLAPPSNTPSRFLQECKDYSISPSFMLTLNSEQNPFETTFKNAIDSLKDNGEASPASSSSPGKEIEVKSSSEELSTDCKPFAPPKRKNGEESPSHNPSNRVELSPENHLKKPRKESKPKAKKALSDKQNRDEDREKFLERNRVAASKCRQRKKAWTQEIERKSVELTERNKFLKENVTMLKDEVMRLKNLLLAHHNCDCKLIHEYFQQSSQVSVRR